LLAISLHEITLRCVNLYGECSEPLVQLGLQSAFDDKADFSGMVKSREKELKISSVLHQAVMIIDEVGTEAAAATVVVMRLKSAAVKRQPRLFVADSPYLAILIHTASSLPLFVASVASPVAV